jgi:hypothetical protein
MTVVAYTPDGEPFDEASFREALAADPALARCARAALRGFESLDDVTACFGGTGESGGRQSRHAARDGGAAVSPLGPPSALAEQQFEEAYRAYAAQDGFAYEAPPEGAELVTVPLAEIERLEALAAWDPDAQYAAFFGEEPRV